MSISSYIKLDLRSRLGNARAGLPELTLESLAEHYAVSFTPVRAAVAELVAEGVLRKGPNRRLTVVAREGGPAEEGALEVPSPPPAPRDLYKVVENDLVHLSLKGEAIYLREEAAAQQYGISRSAMRNIFHRLAGAGLLTHMPRRGWQVRPFRQEDMQAFLEIRELLELKALELAQGRLADREIQALLEANQLPGSADAWPRIDNSLHAYIIAQAQNPYIQDFFQRQGRYYEILFDWEDQDRDTAMETVRQHREILEAILRRDWRAARKALSHHIRCNHPILKLIVTWKPDSTRPASHA